MKDLIKEYKTQIAIIVGALIVAFAIYFSTTAEYRNKVNACVKAQNNSGFKTIVEQKDWCIEMIARYGRW